MTLNEAIVSLEGKSHLDAEDALTIRRVVFANEAVIDTKEADALFDLNARAVTVAREWRELFAEAITDYVVRQQTPVGFVNDAQADWLVACCLKHGRLREDELDALVHVIEAADQSPAKLTEFIMSAVKDLAIWRIQHEKRLKVTDIARLEQLLFATGGQGNTSVTRAEAEVLFDINDALGDAEVDPSWRDLFVKAIANSVLVQTTWTPSIDRARRQDEWVRDLDIAPMERLLETTGFVEGLRTGFKSLFTSNFTNEVSESKLQSDMTIQAQAEVFTEAEAVWLFDRLGQNGHLDDNEQALITFIRRNASALSPSFQERLNGLSELR